MNGIVSTRFLIVLTLILAGMVLLPMVVSAQPSGAVGDSVGGSVTPGWGQMSAEQRQQTVEYSNTKNILYFVGEGYGLLVLLLILLTGFSSRLRNWAAKIGRKRFLTIAVFTFLIFLVIGLTGLPLDYYSGYHLEHQYGLSNQSVGGWFWDQVKEFLISWIIAVLLVAILYALIRKYPRTWWVWFGAGSLPFIIFFMIIAPIFLMPMFYDFKPMEESPLKARIVHLASEAGVDDPDIFVMNASESTNKLNAMVTGLGETKRIVFYDNLLEQMSDDEILFVTSHELGHYLMNHVWIGVFLSVAMVFILLFLANLLIGSTIRRFSSRLGFSQLSDIASFPLILFFVSLFAFLSSPITSGIWRHFEHQADIFGMDHTGNGEAAARAFEKLAAGNLANPNPPAFVEFWLYSHPKLSDRIQFVRSYQPERILTDPLRFPGERHLKNLRQLTFGGENAEAYFSADGRQLIFQSTRDSLGCDQIFTMGIAGENPRLVSTGGGVTTCSFFAPDGERIIYSSTRLGGEECPPKPSHEAGYVWAIYPDYDIFSAKPDGSDLRRLTDTPGYDAEAVYSSDGNTVLFTSVRDGDLELYLMNPDGSNVRRLTHEIGYDGGAFFSPDGSRIVYRAHHPQSPEAIAEYQGLLARNLVRPSQMEIFVADVDGSNRRQITRNGAANFCPFFHPNGRQIIFSSNMNDPSGRNFELYLINDDGTGLEQITYNETFDAFPMFSADGSKLVFCSNRNNNNSHETNIFIADWVE